MLEKHNSKCSASIHLKGTNHQPECSQGSIPEKHFPPSATNSEMCPSQRIPQDDPEQREFKVCSNLTDGSAKQLISHYDTLHFSDQPALHGQVKLEKSDGTLRLNIKDPALSGSEFRELKSTTVAKLTAERTIQVHFWWRKEVCYLLHPAVGTN